MEIVQKAGFPPVFFIVESCLSQKYTAGRSLLQQLSQHPVTHNKCSGQMEGTLEGRALGTGLGGQSIPPQIAVPLSVFRLPEVMETPLVQFQESAEEVFVTG